MPSLLGVLLMVLMLWRTPASAHEATLHGLVLAALPKSGEVVVRHDAIFGAPAGVSTFRIQRADARRLRVGASIEALADADSKPWTLSDVRVVGMQAVIDDRQPSAAPQILRNVQHIVVGQYAPVPRLLDERGGPFSLRDLRGQTIVMAFVYTRCRDARECPLITARFARLQERFRHQPVHLVEVTLDPEYDRPAVLARYGSAYGEDPSRWTFVTGDPETVLDFAAQFDVTAFPDARVGVIHAERLVIIDRYGAVRDLIDEGAWTPDEVVAEVQHDQRLASNPFERLDLWLSSAAVSVCGNAVAGFSGFTDLLTVLAIAVFFGYIFWRLGRAIARGAA